MEKKLIYNESISGENYKIAIIKSRWNSDITSRLYEGCISVLKEKNVKSENILEYEVPGSYELPIAANIVVQQKNVDAIICLGCIIKGETKHDMIIAQSVSDSILDLSKKYNIPVIFGVLTTESMDQAVERSGGKVGNKGTESAYTALKMIHLFEQIKKPNSKNWV
ncbi:MAG: 6,7-dimethyl-8-ribityllumazine synthase [Saprospiraceae bacterium]